MNGKSKLPRMRVPHTSYGPYQSNHATKIPGVAVITKTVPGREGMDNGAVKAFDPV